MKSSADLARQKKSFPPKKKGFSNFLATVEWLGNLLPHPVTLFAIFCAGVLLVSAVAGFFELSVIDPRPDGAAGKAADGMISARNLLSAEGIRLIITSVVHNFTGFAPLGTVLVAMLGVSIAEKSGLLAAVIKSMVMGASKQVVTVIVVFAGVISNVGAELGYVVLIPLAAMVFYALGRHPLAGIAAAFCGVSGGYSANLLLGTVDPLLAGITESAAHMIDPGYQVGPESSWYFMIISTFFITAIGSWVTLSIVEPRLGHYDDTNASTDLSNLAMTEITALEKKAMLRAGLTLLILSAIVALAVVPEGAILRHPQTGEVAGSPFLKGIVVFILFFFAIPGIVYGKTAGTIKSDRDVINAMSDGISSLGVYIVLVFFASQFVAFFKLSNLGTIMAIFGSDALQAIGLTGPLLFLFFIIMCAFVNLSLGSASAQWAMTAPIFVPMFMLLGYSPEVTQTAYRIGDSVTNLITPMMSYFGLIVSFAARYQKNIGIGTLIATMLPYSLILFAGWTVLFFIWVFLFGLPVGPHSPTYYVP